MGDIHATIFMDHVDREKSPPPTPLSGDCRTVISGGGLKLWTEGVNHSLKATSSPLPCRVTFRINCGPRLGIQPRFDCKVTASTIKTLDSI